MLPELRKTMNRKAGLLSGGEQQMLAVGRALIKRPRLLLVDEMSLGLAPVIVQRLLPVLRRAATNSGRASCSSSSTSHSHSDRRPRVRAQPRPDRARGQRREIAEGPRVARGELHGRGRGRPDRRRHPHNHRRERLDEGTSRRRAVVAAVAAGASSSQAAEQLVLEQQLVIGRQHLDHRELADRWRVGPRDAAPRRPGPLRVRNRQR